MPVLLEGAKSPHEYLFYSYRNDLQAVRQGKWKLRRYEATLSLYNLDDDPAELTNLVEQHPDVVNHLQSVLKDHHAEISANQRPTGSVANPKVLTLKE